LLGLDSLLAEEQLRGDLRIRLAVGDQPCHLEFAFGQRLQSGLVRLARARASVDGMAELSQLPFRVVAVAQRAAGVEFRGRALQLRRGTVTLPGSSERAARDRARQGSVALSDRRRS
jgi:hypothetical protein